MAFFLSHLTSTKLNLFQDISSKNDANMTSASAFDVRSRHVMMTTTQSSNTHDVITTTTPVAMRSSFAVGVRFYIIAVVTCTTLVLL